MRWGAWGGAAGCPWVRKGSGSSPSQASLGPWTHRSEGQALDKTRPLPHACRAHSHHRQVPIRVQLIINLGHLADIVTVLAASWLSPSTLAHARRGNRWQRARREDLVGAIFTTTTLNRRCHRELLLLQLLGGCSWLSGGEGRCRLGASCQHRRLLLALGTAHPRLRPFHTTASCFCLRGQGDAEKTKPSCFLKR